MMKRRIGLGVMATLAIVAVAVPAADREESTSDAYSRLLSPARDLNAPLDVNTRIGDVSKTTVLIYYANETAPNESEAENDALLMADLTGLQYETLDYEQVFRRVRESGDLADALNAELLAVYGRPKAARAKEAQRDNKSRQDAGPVDKDSASSVPVRDAYVQQ